MVKCEDGQMNNFSSKEDSYSNSQKMNSNRGGPNDRGYSSSDRGYGERGFSDRGYNNPPEKKSDSRWSNLDFDRNSGNRGNDRGYSRNNDNYGRGNDSQQYNSFQRRDNRDNYGRRDNSGYSNSNWNNRDNRDNRGGGYSNNGGGNNRWDRDSNPNNFDRNRDNNFDRNRDNNFDRSRDNNLDRFDNRSQNVNDRREPSRGNDYRNVSDPRDSNRNDVDRRGDNQDTPPRVQTPQHQSPDRKPQDPPTPEVIEEPELLIDWHTIEPPNEELQAKLFAKKPSGIKFQSFKDIPVDVTGEDIPPPIEVFADANLGEILNSNILLCGYHQLTPIQSHSVPIIREERDIMACAQTGSGKTAAFLLPILAHLFKNGPGKASSLAAASKRQARSTRDMQVFPSAVILSPTRELTLQIHEEASKLTYRSKVKSCVVYGGVDQNEQLRELEQGCDLIVATPGRLVDFLKRGKISLTACRYIILDEADRMLDMGFEIQIREIVEKFNLPDRDSRQTLLYSATFPPKIQRLATDFLKTNYIFVTVGKIGSTNKNITQTLEWVEDEDKLDYTVELLDKCPLDSLMILFTETKRSANQFYQELSHKGFKCCCIHGDRNQGEREEALKAFRSKQCPILVATAVAARGLDIPDVRMVINVDLPPDIDEYVHRIGRTGRAGNIGTAISFFNNKKGVKIADDLLKIFIEAGQEIPSWLRTKAIERQNSKPNNNANNSNDRQDIRRGMNSSTNIPHQGNWPATVGKMADVSIADGEKDPDDWW